MYILSHMPYTHTYPHITYVRTYLDKVILTLGIKAQWSRLTIPIVHDTSEQVPTGSKALARLPHHFQGRVIEADLVVVVVLTPEEESVEAHGREEGGLSGRVAKWVYLPCHTRTCFWAKGVLYELEACSCVCANYV